MEENQLVLKIKEGIAGKKAYVGFDGYIDSLFHVVKERNKEGIPAYYPTISAFADRMAQASGKSCDTEIDPVSRKIGGNAPLLADALANFSLDTTCIGTLGYPDLEPEYLNAPFQMISVLPAAKCTAFEFDDGKLMFGDSASLNEITLPLVRGRMGEEAYQALLRADVISFVNWSFIFHANEMLEDLLKDLPEEKEKLLFIDLADPQGRSAEDLLKLQDILKCYSKKRRVAVGLNENEADCVAKVLTNLPADASYREKAEKIRASINASLVVVHGLKYAIGTGEDKTVLHENIYYPHPVISTGAGDHFNGGLVTALLAGCTIEETLLVASRSSGYYVSHGYSGNLEEILA